MKQILRDWTMCLGAYKNLECSVPCSMYSVLFENGKIPDPYYKDNAKELTELSRNDCEFDSYFYLTEDFFEKENLLLVFDGLDTVADIYLNHTKIGYVDNMHCCHKFNIKSVAAIGENHLKVHIYSPIAYIEKKQNMHYIQGDANAMDGMAQIQKSSCMFGWDWAPTLPDMGLYRDIYVHAFHNKIEDVYVRQTHKNGHVLLNIEATFFAETPIADFCVKHPNGEVTDGVLEFGKAELRIDNPNLWWPNGLGAQPLYEIIVKTEEDVKSVKIGLRTLTVSTAKDEYGKEFCFVINGVKFFSMGGDYVPEDSILPRLTPQRTEKLIRACAEANHNSIRVWGGGFYPHDWFYELCDQYGLVVWQDIMIACRGVYLSKWFKTTIVQEVEYNLKRIRNHACLGLICGNNEMEGCLGDTPDKLYFNDYLELYEHIFPDICAELTPDIFYWPSSPSSGGGFDNPNDFNRGDQHYWETWHGNKPFESYRDHYFRFCSEFGFEAFPSIKTIGTFAEKCDYNPFSWVMEFHQKCKNGNMKMLNYISEQYLYPTGFESFVYASQIIQADAIRYGVEHFRRNRGRCMGAIYWQLNDCWPVASWSSIDYFGRWKALHYASKRFFAPVLMSLCENGTDVTINISNEQRKPFNGKVKYSLKNTDFITLFENEAEVCVDAMSSGNICHENFEALVKGNERNLFLVAELLNADGEAVSEATLLFTKPKYFNWETANYNVDIHGENGNFTVEISTQKYQKFVALDFDNVDGIFSDNYFDITDSTPKTLTFRTDDISVTADELKKQLNIMSVAKI